MTALESNSNSTQPTPHLSPGTWAIDPGHAEVAFIGRHFGLTRIRGRFTGVDGVVEVGTPLESSTVEVTIDMASVATGSTDRDEHLRSSDLFDVDTHPTATFRSTAVVADGSTGWIDGELTIRGVTRPVRLDVVYLGQAVDPWDNERAVFTASTTIDRDDFGVSWNMVLDAGGLLVSKQIRIEIDVELIRR